jgi:hypothetical protein
MVVRQKYATDERSLSPARIKNSERNFPVATCTQPHIPQMRQANFLSVVKNVSSKI